MTVATVIRTYNNERVFQLIRRLEKIESLNKVYVVMNALKDAIRSGSRLLNLVTRLDIEVLHLENYGWSKGLNAAIEKAAFDHHTHHYFLSISNEVIITDKIVRNMIHQAENALVSCAYVLFKGRNERSYAIPRNTCCLWPMPLFDKIGFFNEEYDDSNGMEDYDMVLRAYQTSGLLPALAHVNVGLLDPIYAAFFKKSKAEETAMRKIESTYSHKTITKVWCEVEKMKHSFFQQ